MQGRGGRGEGVGRGGGRRGRGRRRREGSGETEGQFLLSPLPPCAAPLSWAAWRCSEPDPAKPGLGAGVEPERPPARPRGCQADVVGHLKFTEGGGRVKVMVSRAVCERVCFRRRRASAIDLPLAKPPRRCPREGAAGLLWPGRARRRPGRGRSGEQGHARAVRSANIPLFFPLPCTQGVDALGSGCAFFPLPLGKKKKMPPCSPFFACPLEVLRIISHM